MVASYLGIESKEPLRVTEENFASFLKGMKLKG
jgi:hypothetical protein